MFYRLGNTKLKVVKMEIKHCIEGCLEAYKNITCGGVQEMCFLTQ